MDGGGREARERVELKVGMSFKRHVGGEKVTIELSPADDGATQCSSSSQGEAWDDDGGLFFYGKN